MIRPIAAIAATLALTACGGGESPDSTSSPPPSPATTSERHGAFRTSFLRSCLDAIPGKPGTTYCYCTVERLESSFTDAQLGRLTRDNPKLRAATRACAEKAGLRVSPGQ